MQSTRKEFTNDQKAEIFRRDKATCCFSGANLWLLDAPLRHGWESDWVDHVRPSSRGGSSETRNGVCASATFNVKKRNNSADTAYLFLEGHPTSLYFELFGPPPAHVISRLKRLSTLEGPDWYFNRMICWVLQAYTHRWGGLPEYKRKDDYWLNAAFKKLTEFQRKSERASCSGIDERGLVQDPSDTQLFFLSLRNCDSSEVFKRRALELSPAFTRNSDVWWSYFRPEFYADDRAKHDKLRHRAFEKATKLRDQLTADTYDCIQADYFIRFGNL